MVIRNKATGKTYPCDKKNWESLGSRQNLFTVESDSDENIGLKDATQKVTNAAPTPPQKPNTGDKPQNNKRK